MRVPRFFAMLKAARQNRGERLGKFYSEMVDIAVSCNQSNDYYKSLKGHYREWWMTEDQIKKIRNPRQFDLNDKNQADAAANIIASALQQKAKIEGLRRG
jgi:hypothetical protein